MYFTYIFFKSCRSVTGRMLSFPNLINFDFLLDNKTLSNISIKLCRPPTFLIKVIQWYIFIVGYILLHYN